MLKKHLSLTVRCLELVWRTSPSLLIASVLTTAAASGLTLAMAYVAKEIIDAAQARSIVTAGFWVASELGLVLLKDGLQRLSDLSRSVLGNRLAVSVQEQILRKASEMDLAQFEDPKVADKLLQANREASARPVAILSNTLESLRNILMLGGYTTILVAYSPWMAIGIALAALPAALIEARFSQKAFGIQNRRSPIRRKLNYFDFLLTRDAHAKELKVFSLGKYFLKQIGRAHV